MQKEKTSYPNLSLHHYLLWSGIGTQLENMTGSPVRHTRRDDNINMDLTETRFKDVNWISLVQDMTSGALLWTRLPYNTGGSVCNYQLLKKESEWKVGWSCKSSGFYWEGALFESRQRHTDYPEWGFPRFSTDPPNKLRGRISNHERLLPNPFQFIIRQSIKSSQSIFILSTKRKTQPRKTKKMR
jgi:hypothetical protein